MKYFFVALFASVIGAGMAIYGYHKIYPLPVAPLEQAYTSHESLEPRYNDTEYVVPEGLDFRAAAHKVTPAVVHIKTYYKANGRQGRNYFDELLRDFFGERGGGGGSYHGNGEEFRMSSGSGVIISSDGYVATNNHVIERASKVEVVLIDKRSFVADVIGVDPTTDLALLKINAKGLVNIPYGNSDNVQIGQWVLAVGNPFDLTSTVTAGIVSAKARNINILRSKTNLSIESFIQTDAAVNPGNSGGALVDLQGNLIGINTAIATNTGSFAGYSFAVPVTLVGKVMGDLKEFGEVQRALMGVSIVDVNAETAKEFGLDLIEGVYIANVMAGSGADDAGLKKGDVVLKIEAMPVNTASELQEIVGRNRPGDKIKVFYRRDGQVIEALVTLKNKLNTTEMITSKNKEALFFPLLGAELQELQDDEKQALGIEAGFKVKRLQNGRLKEAGVPEGFIITHIDKRKVKTVMDLHEEVTYFKGGVLFEGIQPNGEKAFFGIGF